MADEERITARMEQCGCSFGAEKRKRPMGVMLVATVVDDGMIVAVKSIAMLRSIRSGGGGGDGGVK